MLDLLQNEAGKVTFGRRKTTPVRTKKSAVIHRLGVSVVVLTICVVLNVLSGLGTIPGTVWAKKGGNGGGKGGGGSGGNILVFEDIPYCTMEGVDPIYHSLDLARPDDENIYPGIMFIHGGSMAFGDKNRFTDMLREAAEKGYVAVSVNYRLTLDDQGFPTGWIFPDPVIDVKCAVRWMRANSEFWGLHPDRIGVSGSSAGGNLALMAGLSSDIPEFEAGPYLQESSDAQVVVNIYGSTDFTLEPPSENRQRYLGGTMEEVPQNYLAASPVNYVDSLDPPILSLYGSVDPLLPHANALDDTMFNVGAFHELVIYAGEGHGFFFGNKKNARNARQRLFQFFADQL